MKTTWRALLAGVGLQRRKILILVGVFLATLPISYIIDAFIPFGLPISDALIRLGVYWVDAAHIAYWSTIILTSLFFTFIAWLLSAEKKPKVQERI